MRSTTFTNIVTAVLLCASPAAATQVVDCYDRTYSAAHLRDTPAQSVKRITAALVADDASSGDLWHNRMVLRVIFAEQGQGGENVEPNTPYVQDLICYAVEDPYGYPDWVEVGSIFCGVEGDGGVIGIRRQSDTSLTLWTEGITLAEPDWEAGTEPPFLTAEGNDSVLFRLDRNDASTCVFGA